MDLTMFELVNFTVNKRVIISASAPYGTLFENDYQIDVPLTWAFAISGLFVYLVFTTIFLALLFVIHSNMQSVIRL